MDHVNGNDSKGDRKFNTFTNSAQKAFNDTLNWLGDWACSRSFGLGTQVPWDKKFVIESLSDSTIYMAYYTIAHKLQGRLGGDDDFTGEGGSPIGLDLSSVSVDQTNALFDFIYLNKLADGTTLPELAKSVSLSEKDILEMQSEFEYWYPFNLRTSGKDLIKNHLTMSLYNHAAIWEDRPELWPKAFFVNGQIQVDAQKMSKSTGNFIMLSESVEGHVQRNLAGKDVVIGWSADATRFACADAGDTLEDSNFSLETANAIILRLTTELEFISSFVEDKTQFTKRTSEEYTFYDKTFANSMNYLLEETFDAYENMRFRDVLKFGYFNFQTARDTYRDACSKMGLKMDEQLISTFINRQLVIISPVCKHWAEYIWRKVLGNSGSITRESWPKAEEVDIVLKRGSEFVEELIVKSRKGLLDILGKRWKGQEASEPGLEGKSIIMTVYVSRHFPEWKQWLLDFAKEVFDTSTQSPKDGALKQLKEFCKDHVKLSEKSMFKKAMQVGAFIIKRSEVEKEKAFEKEMIFDQKGIIEQNLQYICKAVGVQSITVAETDELENIPVEAQEAEPGVPKFVFSSGD
eukprot:maker-scaffold_5-snap-gene-2.40-mRNA-1 protein AED:0.33 eAED:0.33 QI:0/0.5/0.33/1/1/1/3/67/575